jgi:integrase
MAGKYLHPLLARLSLTAVTPAILDSFYAELRRCRDHCRHPKPGHRCRPLAPATIRKLHYLLGGARCAGVDGASVLESLGSQGCGPRLMGP